MKRRVSGEKARCPECGYEYAITIEGKKICGCVDPNKPAPKDEKTCSTKTIEVEGQNCCPTEVTQHE